MAALPQSPTYASQDDEGYFDTIPDIVSSPSRLGSEKRPLIDNFELDYLRALEDPNIPHPQSLLSAIHWDVTTDPVSSLVKNPLLPTTEWPRPDLRVLFEPFIHELRIDMLDITITVKKNRYNAGVAAADVLKYVRDSTKWRERELGKRKWWGGLRLVEVGEGTEGPLYYLQLTSKG